MLGGIKRVKKGLTGDPASTTTPEGYPMDEKQNRKIADRLDQGEEVAMSIRQSRIKAGGSPVTPNAVFITPKRVLIRNPTRLGLGEQVEDFLYDDITNVRLERGMTSSSLVFTIPGLTEMSKIERNTNSMAFNIWGRDTPGTIDALPRDKAEKAYVYIRERIQEAKEKRKEVRVVGGTNADGKEPAAQNPLDALKMRFVNGEISAEEYEKMKKVLEGVPLA
ncbi:MAG: SHOCT domain-containing protein [Nitrosopumilaceae archaeon]|nr:SHOCT domain-containing protein [Nitrosopumilaceae archaeon]